MGLLDFWQEKDHEVVRTNADGTEDVLGEKRGGRFTRHAANEWANENNRCAPSSCKEEKRNARYHARKIQE